MTGVFCNFGHVGTPERERAPLAMLTLCGSLMDKLLIRELVRPATNRNYLFISNIYEVAVLSVGGKFGTSRQPKGALLRRTIEGGFR
jgi:hypothetical protein